VTTVDETAALERLLEHVQTTRGFDFSGYKRGTLERRIRRRLTELGIDGFDDYLDYLQVHADEYALLFNTILINFTGFFRDASAWEYLAREILPHVIEHKSPEQPIRVWSAGCASGEEAYTLAMLFAEALGADAFSRRVKIYATDVDEDALGHARQAYYHTKDLEPVPAELRARYFELQGDGRYAFSADLRRMIIFGRHDLVQDAPISRLDLLACRNTLMYFNAQTQGSILAKLHFALVPAGFLFLGKAEMLLSHGSLFMPANLKYRIFTPVRTLNMRDRLLMATQGVDVEGRYAVSEELRLRELSFEVSPVAQVVVNAHGTLVLANEAARTSYNLSARDLGRPFQDVELSYRPAELRTQIERSYAERRSQVLRHVERHLGQEPPQYLDIELVPLFDADQHPLGVSITLIDTTRSKHLLDELERSHEELETAYEELQSSNEELETTNEELQSTVEELETTNEELQSTNEELETMNEELQSTNQELQTVNEEMRQRTDEVGRAYLFLDAVLSSLGGAVVVLGSDQVIEVWSPGAEELWGVRPAEALERRLADLDIGLPLEELQELIRSCLAGRSADEEVLLAATNRRGRPVQCRIRATPLMDQDGKHRGVVLVMEDTGEKALP
jgi:two-component system, chemotaxis family, CheB/CheR fusion protein